MKKIIIKILSVIALGMVLFGCQTELRQATSNLKAGMSKEEAWQFLKKYGQPQEALGGVPVIVNKSGKIVQFLRKDSIYIDPEKSKIMINRMIDGYKKTGQVEKAELCYRDLENLNKFKERGDRVAYVELWVYAGEKSTEYRNIFIIFRNGVFVDKIELGFNQNQLVADELKSQRQAMAAGMLIQQGNAYNSQLQQQRYYNRQNSNLQNINNSLQQINSTLNRY